MPRELKTWGCDYRCGYTNTKRAKIEKHEKTCFCNPGRRACKTCKHDYKDPHDSEGCYCDHPDGDDLRPYANGLITCRYDCPGWAPKSVTPSRA